MPVEVMVEDRGVGGVRVGSEGGDDGKGPVRDGGYRVQVELEEGRNTVWGRGWSCSWTLEYMKVRVDDAGEGRRWR